MININDYPMLQKVLKEAESLTILCGAGVSCALSEQPVTWYNWLKRGISYIPTEFQQSISEKLEAYKLVEVASELLQITKKTDTYIEWMNSSFSTLSVQNQHFAECFIDLQRLSDKIVTTNYDMLLELATSTGTVTYNQPELILQMIQHKVDQRIIHIHGAYNEDVNLDDIIADDTQYKEIVQNEGAQFLQNLLSIQPMIFIGCGQTIDDPNISRFISFAKSHLNTEIPYFFLYKQGDDLSSLGEYIQPICYGDHYNDLHNFLRSMVDYRFQQRSITNQIIELNPYVELSGWDTRSDLYYFGNNKSIQFIGREKEIRQLNEFILTEDKLSWWAITGESGIGKSRLAYEFLKQLPSNWFGFFLRNNITVEDIEAFKPFNNTVIVIDHMQTNFPAYIITALFRLFKESKYQFRMILIERDNILQFGGWYQNLIASMSSFDQSIFIAAAYQRPEEITFLTKPLPTKAFLNLKGLDDTASKAIIHKFSVRLQSDLSHEITNNIYQSFLQNVDKGCHRPLYLLIFVEYYLANNGQISAMNKVDLFSHLLLKEQNRWLQLLNGNHHGVSDIAHLMSLACAVGHIHMQGLEPPYKEYWENVVTAKIKWTVTIK